jgi:iron complex transport system ATP-binding protein
MNGLLVRELTVALGGKPLLKRVGFELAAGEVVALIGPNGVGKTTCLRAILGLVPAEAERLEAGGRAVASLTPCERARALAYLPQSRHIAWPLTVAATVGLGRHPHAREAADAQSARVARVLASMGISSLAQRDVRTLSGGELALALLARALIVEAPVLLADEPVAALDLAHQLTVMKRLREIAQAGAAVLVVLHDLALAARFCDRLILLAEGRVAADGPPDSVMADPALEAAYGIRLIRGEIHGIPVAVAEAR